MFILKIFFAYICISLFLNVVLFFPLIVQRIRDRIAEERKRKKERESWFK